MNKEKFQLKFYLNATQHILYGYLELPQFLEEWYADKVTVNSDVYTFEWEGLKEDATCLSRQPEESIRWQWQVDQGTQYYFELQIQPDKLAGEMELIITDFAEPSEVAGAKTLWHRQIDHLKFILNH